MCSNNEIVCTIMLKEYLLFVFCEQISVKFLSTVCSFWVVVCDLSILLDSAESLVQVHDDLLLMPLDISM